MSTDSHISKRDGHLNLGGPRPAQTPRASRAPRQHPPAPAALSDSYNDSGTVGVFDLGRKTFEATAGHPSPRQKLERGEAIDGKHDRVAPQGTHQTPGDASIAGAAPLT
jgi:hypothetical protein